MEADLWRRGLKWEGFQVKENGEAFSPGFIFLAIFCAVSKQCASAGWRNRTDSGRSLRLYLPSSPEDVLLSQDREPALWLTQSYIQALKYMYAT